MRSVVYGMSTEGYNIASRMASRNVEVYMIDESMGSAIELRPEFAQIYPDITALLDDEPLLNTKSASAVIDETDYLFFAPCIRRMGKEARTEVNSKFQDAISELREGAAVICNIPTGIGGNAEFISLIRHVTGLEVGKHVPYYYYPLDGKYKPSIIGAVGKKDAQLVKLMGQGQFVGIRASEMAHSVNVLAKFATTASTIEIFRHAQRDTVEKETIANTKYDMFLDSMIGGRYDLQLISESQADIKPIQYLINSSLKGLDGYIKRLVDYTRTTLRDRGYMVSRTNIAIAWSVDKQGIRGDKIEALANLSNRLRDYAGHVEEYDYRRTHQSYRTALVLACSSLDYERVVELEAESGITIVKATPLM